MARRNENGIDVVGFADFVGRSRPPEAEAARDIGRAQTAFGRHGNELRIR